MKTRYVVLRRGQPQATRDRSQDVLIAPTACPFGGPVEAVASMLSTQFETLDPREAHELHSDPEVAVAAPAMPMRLIAPLDTHAVSPADLADDVTWGVRAVGADRSTFDGTGVTVAVLDTGIDATHPAFNGVELQTENFTTEAPEDQHGHGTHCAGTMFGRDVDGIRIGVARGVRSALIGKVLGSGSTSESIVKAIKWAADNGAQVISMSLGTDFPRYVQQLRQAGYPEELAISFGLEGYRANVRLFEAVSALLRAQHQPIMLVAAAGNESRRKIDPRFELAVAPPATAEGFVSVAALGRSAVGLIVADFSNTGAMVAGPGVDVISAQRGGGLVAMSGTSMATPHVAGVTALWVQRLQNQHALSQSTLNGRLIGGATLQGLIDSIDPTDVGAGLVQAPT